MRKQLTRRQFLRLSGGALLGAFLPHPPSGRLFRPRADGPVRMGRAIHAVAIYDAAEAGAERLGAFQREDTFPIVQEVRAPGLNAHNDLWYETSDGYVFSAWVQPCWVWPPQLTETDVGEWGFWGEICVPYTDARDQPHSGANSPYRFYNGTVYHIVDVAFDEEENGWYKVYDELPPPSYQWVLARDVRRIPRSDLTPIHPFAGAKRVEVDLSERQIMCFEGERLVFTTPTAPGLGLRQIEEDVVEDLRTPEGDHCILLKQPSRHMSNLPREPGDPYPAEPFDLPGVPWNTFFDLRGTAIHGTYWHNDFGVPRSHGCLNVPIDAARWIYRWTHPISGAEDDYVQSDCRVGTPISVY